MKDKLKLLATAIAIMVVAGTLGILMRSCPTDKQMCFQRGGAEYHEGTGCVFKNPTQGGEG